VVYVRLCFDRFCGECERILELKNDWVLHVPQFISGSIAFVKDEIMKINEMSKTDELMIRH